MMTENESEPALSGKENGFSICAWARPGVLYVWCPFPVEVYIYTLNGKLWAFLKLPAGRSETPVAPGTYIVFVDKTSFKLTF